MSSSRDKLMENKLTEARLKAKRAALDIMLDGWHLSNSGCHLSFEDVKLVPRVEHSNCTLYFGDNLLH